MRIFTDNNTKKLFLTIAAIIAAFSLLAQMAVWWSFRSFSLFLLLLSIAAVIGVLAACLFYFNRQEELLETAVSQIQAYLAGDRDVRIDCDKEGAIYKLFHAVNNLAAVLNAHAEKEVRAKEFLRNTISDISHQLKTPLAALNIYNGLLEGEARELPAIREFVGLSEQELDRMETLVQNLLKMTKLDAHTIVFEKAEENVADMMQDVALHFAYRAKQEQKELGLSGGEELTLYCDRDWLLEAVNNIVKNAFDHTKENDVISIAWKRLASGVQITVGDTGSGIAPEDLHHIFKRFYRSRFSKDVQGIGLGLSLAKAVIEAHGGTIAADSRVGGGSVFIISFL